jgi:hypothetical protein
VGWLLIGFVLLAGFSIDAGFYAVLRYRLGYSGLPLAPVVVLLTPLWAAAVALLPPVILLFPDGRLASRHWRWLLWIYAGLVACVLIAVCAPAVAAVAGHDIRVDSSGDVRSARDLADWLTHPPPWLATVVLVLIAAIALSFVAHQAFSWRRATGERRQQLKWLAFGAAITIGLGLVAANFTSGIVSEIFSAGIIALPVSMGIGILKYRLYDIDRIISRTLAYALVTGLLVGVYAGLVLLTTQVFRIHTPVAVAASTLAAAALFNPLRRRVQKAVDRRFNRARYDADQTIAAFAARLQDAVDLDAVQDDLAGVVHQALEPAHVSVWISQRTETGFSQLLHARLHNKVRGWTLRSTPTSASWSAVSSADPGLRGRCRIRVRDALVAHRAAAARPTGLRGPPRRRPARRGPPHRPRPHRYTPMSRACLRPRRPRARRARPPPDPGD